MQIRQKSAMIITYNADPCYRDNPCHHTFQSLLCLYVGIYVTIGNIQHDSVGLGDCLHTRYYSVSIVLQSAFCVLNNALEGFHANAFRSHSLRLLIL